MRLGEGWGRNCELEVVGGVVRDIEVGGIMGWGWSKC